MPVASLRFPGRAGMFVSVLVLMGQSKPHSGDVSQRVPAERIGPALGLDCQHDSNILVGINPMPINQFELVFQFSAHVAELYAVTFLAVKLSRFLARPRGTYGDGLPERRARPRLVLRDPKPVQESEAASTLAA